MTRSVLLILTLFSCYSIYGQSDHETIKTNLKKLGALVGQWNVTTENISHSGVRSEETGTYDISWTLDSTYIVRKGILTNKKSKRSRQFVSWLTFDPSVNKFKWVFFYDKRANQIIEYGTYDENNQTFTTYTSFEIDNGVTEYIRHVLDFTDPNKILSRAWIRLDEGEENNTFTAILSRSK